MALPVAGRHFNFFKFVVTNQQILNLRLLNTSMIRTVEKDPQSLSASDWQTVILPNGVIACWHPEKPFPYEHSRPLDLEETEREKQKFMDRVRGAEPKEQLQLKVPGSAKGPNNYILRELFYTDMQEWRPRYREKRLYASTVRPSKKPIPSNPVQPLSAPAITGDPQQAIGAQPDEQKNTTAEVKTREKEEMDNKQK